MCWHGAENVNDSAMRGNSLRWHSACIMGRHPGTTPGRSGSRMTQSNETLYVVECNGRTDEIGVNEPRSYTECEQDIESLRALGNEWADAEFCIVEDSDGPCALSPVAAAERALGIEIGRTSGGRLYYTAYDEGTLTGYYLTRADLAHAVECRREYGRKAYSHWCAETVTRRMSAAALARATS